MKYYVGNYSSIGNLKLMTAMFNYAKCHVANFTKQAD